MPTAYRPPPPAPSAYYAMQLNPNPSSQQVATPNTFLCRVPSKHSMQQFPDPVAQPSGYSSNVSTRSSSAASIAALPSLSGSLNNLANITSMEQISLTGTRTAAEGEEMVSSFSLFHPLIPMSHVSHCLFWSPETDFQFIHSSGASSSRTRSAFPAQQLGPNKTRVASFVMTIPTSLIRIPTTSIPPTLDHPNPRAKLLALPFSIAHIIIMNPRAAVQVS
jgi:hypothetical protein